MFGSTQPAASEAAEQKPLPPTTPTPQPDVPRRALELLDQAERALRAGDYATFGARLQELKRVLQQSSSPQ
jgi:uncharacterized membrane protein (UPF0182 family)